MPIHDWTRVTDGTFHDFHVAWWGEIRTSLNSGVLPPEYYAQAEQIAGPLGPDVLTLQTNDTPDENRYGGNGEWHPDLPADGANGGLAIATAKPRIQLVDEAPMDDYVLKRRMVVIRHTSCDRIVALIDIVSPGNKSSKHALTSFVEKAVVALFRGYHLLIIDLFPPTPRDPEGIHSAIWHEFRNTAFALPNDSPLTLASYSSGYTKRAYVEPTAVGRELAEMPLFLTEDGYVNVPLEATYCAAYRGVPRKWKAVLEGTGAQ